VEVHLTQSDFGGSQAVKQVFH